jgi:hypothetical protein
MLFPASLFATVKELKKENRRLKHLVGELSLEKQVLREVAQQDC